MNSNGQPIKNSFTSKININNNNIEGVKDIIISDKPISQTIDDFKNQDINILERLLILENNSSYLESCLDSVNFSNCFNLLVLDNIFIIIYNIM